MLPFLEQFICCVLQEAPFSLVSCLLPLQGSIRQANQPLPCLVVGSLITQRGGTDRRFFRPPSVFVLRFLRTLCMFCRIGVLFLYKLSGQGSLSSRGTIYSCFFPSPRLNSMDGTSECLPVGSSLWPQISLSDLQPLVFNFPLTVCRFLWINSTHQIEVMAVCPPGTHFSRTCLRLPLWLCAFQRGWPASPRYRLLSAFGKPGPGLETDDRLPRLRLLAASGRRPALETDDYFFRQAGRQADRILTTGTYQGLPTYLRDHSSLISRLGISRLGWARYVGSFIRQV